MRPLTALAGCVLAAELWASSARAGSFRADNSVDVIARRLQARLPACAVDGLIEGDRDGSEWHYKLLLKFDKTRVIEARAHLDGTGDTTMVEVDVVLVEGRMFFSTERTLPDETAEWTERVRLLAGTDSEGAECARFPHVPGKSQ